MDGANVWQALLFCFAVSASVHSPLCTHCSSSCRYSAYLKHTSCVRQCQPFPSKHCHRELGICPCYFCIFQHCCAHKIQKWHGKFPSSALAVFLQLGQKNLSCMVRLADIVGRTHDYGVQFTISHDVGLTWDFTGSKAGWSPTAVQPTGTLCFHSKLQIYKWKFCFYRKLQIYKFVIWQCQIMRSGVG